MNDWHALALDQIISHFQTDKEGGLSAREAKKRLTAVGQNTLAEYKRPSPAAIFFSQFSDFMVLVLIGAALLSGWLGEWNDAVTILSIVFLNAVLGFVQEYRAEKSLDALRRLSAPLARVKRRGEMLKIF